MRPFVAIKNHEIHETIRNDLNLSSIHIIRLYLLLTILALGPWYTTILNQFITQVWRNAFISVGPHLVGTLATETILARRHNVETLVVYLVPIPLALFFLSLFAPLQKRVCNGTKLLPIHMAIPFIHSTLSAPSSWNVLPTYYPHHLSRTS